MIQAVVRLTFCNNADLSGLRRRTPAIPMPGPAGHEPTQYEWRASSLDISHCLSVVD